MTKFVVLLGDYNNKNDDIDDGQIMRDIKQVLIHPAYRHQNYDNDLALLRLESPVVYSKYVLSYEIPFDFCKYGWCLVLLNAMLKNFQDDSSCMES